MRFPAVISAILVALSLLVPHRALFAQEKAETAYDEVIRSRIQNSNRIVIFKCDNDNTSYHFYIRKEGEGEEEKEELLLEIIETRRGGIFIRYFDDIEVDGVPHHQWTVAGSANPPAKMSWQTWFFSLRTATPNSYNLITENGKTDCRFVKQILIPPVIE